TTGGLQSCCRNVSTMIGKYKAVQSEEGGSGGAHLEPLVALAQNGVNMHNILGPACIFLRKGFAESRQAVRKSGR
uniref:Uncharacterized protein n=1 Tax=Neogobius melanostomus TaxID=47308 RepID=A0A8C6WKF9_9GOBI